MKYEIKGGNMPVAIINLENGESLSTQGGAMSWMSANLTMETEGGGGLGAAFGRMLSGEKIFRNIYTAHNGSGMIAIGSSFPGAIVAIELKYGQSIIAQKSAFLAASLGIHTEIFLNKKVGTGLFGGEGFIMQRISGNGIVFLEIDGSAIEYELQAGEKLVVDTGSLAFVDSSCNIDIQTVKGVKNILFGGEGLFNTVITGPGKVTLQTMPIPHLAEALLPYIPTQSSNN